MRLLFVTAAALSLAGCSTDNQMAQAQLIRDQSQQACRAKGLKEGTAEYQQCFQLTVLNSSGNPSTWTGMMFGPQR